MTAGAAAFDPRSLRDLRDRLDADLADLEAATPPHIPATDEERRAEREEFLSRESRRRVR